MSTWVMNHVPGMILHSGNTINIFGKDKTNRIAYTFNQQGFRGINDFNYVPDYAFFGCSMVFGIGVPENDTFAYQFKNSQNYGLAGNYDNSDVFELINQFVDSHLYTKHTKIAVVWHLRDVDNLESYYQKLRSYKILHFFCGSCLPYDRCYPVLPNIDHDVSNTHYGPRSHRAFWKILCTLFNQ
jgi:hypothetical protein